MKHQIKIFYTTGDSFHSEDTSNILELDWDNLDVAKENLKRIKEHYICYKVDTDYGGKNGWFYKSLSPEEKLMYDKRTEQSWYCTYNGYGSNSKDGYHYSVKLKTDNGNDFQISSFWIGYFEHLNSAEIISKDNDMKISF